jgi:hypothetical protein
MSLPEWPFPVVGARADLRGPAVVHPRVEKVIPGQRRAAGRIQPGAGDWPPIPP